MNYAVIGLGGTGGYLGGLLARAGECGVEVPVSRYVYNSFSAFSIILATLSKDVEP